ncbi:MAG: hypothetical protein IPO02_16835 [Bacteroidetes bacterium]|jgi:hypothetical protein|nr:hypothetical protein [Bacteroidota bacterium]
MPKQNKAWFIIIYFIWFAIISCSNETSTQLLPKDSVQTTANATKLKDSAKVFLTDGCIVLRRGNDIISEMFSKLNQTDCSYSHCGIAFQENGKWFVYHSIGGEDNPDQKMKKERYENFILPAQNKGFGICQLTLKNAQIDKLHVILDSLYQKKIPFDMKFDLQSDDRLYCAEMVYKSIQQATQNDTFFQITDHKGFKFVSTDNIFVNKQAQLLCRINY